MKKLVIMIMLAICSIGAFAQTEQGQSSFGFNVGYHFNDNGNTYLGIDYRYSITDNWRIAPSINYLVKNNGLSAAAIDVNAHYLFKLSDMFGFYPLLGLDLSFWKFDIGHLEDNATRFGANVGLGGECYVSDVVTVGIEFKYNAIKDFDAAMLGVRVGYTF